MLQENNIKRYRNKTDTGIQIKNESEQVNYSK